MRDKKQEFQSFVDIIEKYGMVSASEYDELDIPGKPARTSLRRWFGGWNELLAVAADQLTTDDSESIADESVRLAAQVQKFRDTNRIERKAWRNKARLFNAIEAFNEELIEVIYSTDMTVDIPVHVYDTPTQAMGIVHFTDAHFNELVDIQGNQFDFSIAAKRCQKYITEARKYFDACGVREVLFAMTGDLINSDRRLDELLNEATNRAKATFLAVKIIRQMLMDLALSYNVIVTCVTGNESRAKQDIAYSDVLATDNYDFTIYNILKLVNETSEAITFIDVQDYNEHVVNVCDQNVLLLHGNQVDKNHVEKSVQQIKGKWIAKGVPIDLVLFGHLHSARIGDTYARGSSIVGANAYSDSALQLTSRASQNIHILYTDRSRDSIKIDLQYYDGYDGYEIDEDLEEYNAKSLAKTHKPITIMEITI
jgi:predicted phosphodiesterase